MIIEQVSAYKSFAGQQLRYKHQSQVLNCEMHFSIYLPPQSDKKKVPVLYWLSGLTCSDENFVIKSGTQQYAAKYGMAIVSCDTSPRGPDVADDINAAYDFGLGAGFYLNATQEPYNKHYQMYDYLVKELPEIINKNFPIDGTKVAISGHSMGGHGALTIGLKNIDTYKSISAFSPICSPINCPWGQKALMGYLGDDKDLWTEYDATELLKQANNVPPILIEQGSEDNFLQEQLKPELLQKVAEEKKINLDFNMQDGYDHSYFFIATFIEKHIKFHSEVLEIR